MKEETLKVSKKKETLMDYVYACNKLLYNKQIITYIEE